MLAVIFFVVFIATVLSLVFVLVVSLVVIASSVVVIVIVILVFPSLFDLEPFSACITLYVFYGVHVCPTIGESPVTDHAEYSFRPLSACRPLPHRGHGGELV